MIATLRQATAPTARAISWTPLLTVGAALLALAGLFRAWDVTSPTVLGVGAGAMAAALVLAWRDRSGALLAAVPVSLPLRRLLRLSLAIAVAAPLWLLVTLLLPGDATAIGTVVALSCSGLGLAAWLPPDADVTLAAGVPLLWATVAELFGDAPGIVGHIAGVVGVHPVPVAAAGVALLLLGRHR